MKKTYLLFYCLTLGLLLFLTCCSSDNPYTPPEKPAPHLNVNDSAVVADIWKKADGQHWLIKWELNNSQTWGGTSWVLDTDKNEYRIVELNINIPVNEDVNGYISPRIGELTELRLFSIGGKGIYGDIPESIANLTHLAELHIQRTSIGGTIPPKLFLLPEITWFNISANPYIRGELPEEITQMPPTLINCNLNGNNLSGKIPSGIKMRRLDLRQNLFTEYPFEYCKEGTTFIDLSSNYIAGIIPDSILNDERALERLHSSIFNNQGTGFTNAPDSWKK